MASAPWAHFLASSLFLVHTSHSLEGDVLPILAEQVAQLIHAACCVFTHVWACRCSRSHPHLHQSSSSIFSLYRDLEHVMAVIDLGILPPSILVAISAVSHDTKSAGGICMSYITIPSWMRAFVATPRLLASASTSFIRMASSCCRVRAKAFFASSWRRSALVPAVMLLWLSLATALIMAHSGHFSGFPRTWCTACLISTMRSFTIGATCATAALGILGHCEIEPPL